jgi:asparagine synthetase B (glutamine-hydrolysing)
MATASTVPLPEYAAQVAAALRHAVAMYRSDQPRDGLLLSGGLDARAVLAASAPPPPVCLTTAPRHNNEVAIAHALARCVGAVHHFMPRPERLLDQLVEPAIFLGGMTVYNEMQFGNYSALIPPGTEMLMMGLALDILLCGHYLPKQPLRVLGRDGYLFRLQPLEHDLAGQFIRSVSYRMKGVDPFTLLKPQRRNAMQEALRSTVAQQMAIGRGHGLDGYDLWESMHLRDFARHYSFLMVASVRCYADCRIPALSNQLYDLALGMPLGYKVNWHAYQQAITQLNPAMMDVRNSNTNIRAATPLWRQSLIRWSRGLANRIPGVHLPRPPSDTDRSWPAVRQSIDVNPTIQDYVSQLASSPCLDALDLFDMDRIGQLVAAHRAGTRDYSVCLNVLVTLDRFLRTQEDLL